MKKYCLFSLFIVQSCLVMAQDRFDKEPYLVKPLSKETISNVEVQTQGGSISVAGVDLSETRIEVYVSPNNSHADITKEVLQQQLNEKYDLDILVSGNKLTAIAKPKQKIKDWKKALNISFRIYVTQNVSTHLSTSGGGISLADLSGTQDFSTSGGSLKVDRIRGKVNGRTSGGSIELEDSKDEIDLITSGGSIRAKNCDGKLRLTTSGGSLHLSGLKGDIKGTTSGGGINGNDIDGDLVAHTSGGSIILNNLSCNLETSTSGGNIHIEVKELRKSIAAKNSGGLIDLIIPGNKGVDLKLTGNKIKTDKLEHFSGKMEEDAIEGKLNGGGIPVTVRAGGGRIYLGIK